MNTDIKTAMQAALDGLSAIPSSDKAEESARVLAKCATSLATATRGQYVLQNGQLVKIHEASDTWVSITSAVTPEPRFLRKSGAPAENPRRKSDAISVVSKEDLDGILDKRRKFVVTSALEDLVASIKSATPDEVEDLIRVFHPKKVS